MKKKNIKRIGLFGGTFNPIHKGHLAIATAALKTFQLDQVIFIPTAHPPHRATKDLAPASHRYRMVQQAIQTTPKFTLSRIEMGKTGPSYAIHTVRKLKKRYGRGTLFYYIIGADEATDLLAWKSAKTLLREIVFLVADRPGASGKKLNRLIQQGALRPFQKNLERFQVSVPVSATMVRAALAQGTSIKGITPAKVARTIKKHKLYQKENR